MAVLLLMAAGAHAQGVFSAWQSLGTSVTQSVTVTAGAAGAVSKVEVLTSGASGMEFTEAGTSPCDTAMLTVGATCTESVTFTPAYPGLRTGAVVLLDLNKNVLGTAYLSGVGQGGLDVLTPGNFIEIAGQLKQVVSTKNGIPATTADLKQPASVALDGAGNLYIADSAHNEVRMVCFSATSSIIAGVTCSSPGIIVDVAGTGQQGYSGDGGKSTAASVTLNAPSGLGLDGAGNLYIADTGNNVIRKITAATGTIATVVGAFPGTPGFGGDGSKATAAGVELDTPLGVTVDVSGNIYIADTANQRIRLVDAATDIISTIAGNGTPSGNGDGKGKYCGDNAAANAACLSLPYAVAFDLYGNMFIPDSANGIIRMVTATSGVISPTSVISTVAGIDPGGASTGTPCTNGATNATPLTSPEGVALDAASNLYISDAAGGCILKANVTSQQIETLAHQNFPDISLAGNPGQAQVYEPIGITLDGLGNVYYADYYFMLISEIQSNKAVLNYQATPVRQGNKSATQLQVVENDGNAASNIISLTPDVDAAVDATATTCAPNPFNLTQDADCTVGAIFAPSTTINPATLPGTVIGNIDVANNTVNSLLDIVLVGNATAVNSTSIALTSNPNPSNFGQSVLFTATVSTGPNTGALTGTVTFTDTFNGNTVTLGAPVTVNASGVATYQTTALVVGVHSVSATYNGDATHLASSQPATVTQTVQEVTKTTLIAAPASPSGLGQSVTFTATVTLPNGGGLPLDGSVTFTDSLATLANNTQTIVNGVATYTTTALVQGVNVITATYTPATTALIVGSSTTLNQDVVSSSSMTLNSAPNPSTYGTSVTFTVTVPNSGSTAATGKVSIVIVPQGQTSPTYPLTVTLAGDPATGTASISTLPVGTYTATATYAGDTNYSSSTSTLATPQVVTQVQTSTAVVGTPNPGIAGKAVAITATVTPAQGTVSPTGTVTFTDTFGGATVTLGGGPINLNKGVATINPANLAPGTHSIVATYSGDADDAGSNGTLTLVINQATTQTTVTAAPNPSTVQGTITFTATVTGNGAIPTGTVTFSASGTAGTTNLGTGTLDATGKTSVTNAALAAGTYQITATYNGDANDAGSSGTTSETVGVIPTTTNLSTATTTGANPQTILVATVQNNDTSGPIPTGTVTFKSGTTTIGSATLDAGGSTTLTPNLPAGNYSIIAYYGGDALHGPSQSSPITVTTVGSSYTLTVAPASVSLAATQNANLTVTLTSLSGFTDTIGLGCASLPAGVNCHFSNITVPLAANATATSTLTIDTNNPLGGGSTAMNKPSGDRKVELAGLFLPFGLLMGWILWRFRKRNASVWSMVLILVLSGAAMMVTGCVGFTQASAAPGTYTIQVVGVGVNSDVPQYQNVTLTITK